MDTDRILRENHLQVFIPTEQDGYLSPRMSSKPSSAMFSPKSPNEKFNLRSPPTQQNSRRRRGMISEMDSVFHSMQNPERVQSTQNTSRVHPSQLRSIETSEHRSIFKATQWKESLQSSNADAVERVNQRNEVSSMRHNRLNISCDYSRLTQRIGTTQSSPRRKFNLVSPRQKQPVSSVEKVGNVCFVNTIANKMPLVEQSVQEKDMNKIR